MTTAKKKIVFCDFDGTITVNDNIVAIIKHFKPDGWEQLVEKVISTEISIQEGVGSLFRLLPASMEKEVIEFGIQNAVIRDGFAEFVQFCKDSDIDFYVTSGGIDFFVYPLLKSFGIPEDHIYCNKSDFTGEQIEILWPHSCDEHCHNQCGMCKPTIMRKFSTEQYERIIIGDSVTDFEGAKIADIVYSRSHLTDKCNALGIAHTEFQTFFDIIEAMKQKG